MSLKPFEEHGHYTNIHDSLFDDVMPMCPPNAWKVMCFVLRKTRGWQKDSDRLSYAQIREGTGIKSDATVRTALDWLTKEEHKLLESESGKDASGRQEVTLYSLNRDFEIKNPSTENVEPSTEIKDGPSTETVETITTGSGNNQEPPSVVSNETTRSPKKQKKKKSSAHFQGPTQDEYREMVLEVVRSDSLGSELMTLIQLAASENDNGKMAASRAWNQFAKPFSEKRSDFPEEAWRVGFEAATRAGAGHLNYVCTTAHKHRMARGADVIGFEGRSAPRSASPACAIEAIRTHASLSCYAYLAEAWDFTVEGRPPDDIYLNLGGTYEERGRNLKSMNSVANRAKRAAV